MIIAAAHPILMYDAHSELLNVQSSTQQISTEDYDVNDVAEEVLL